MRNLRAAVGGWPKCCGRVRHTVAADPGVAATAQCSAARIGGRPVQIDKGANALARLEKNINTEIWGTPSCLGVITARGYVYERDDGIMVIPIGTLAP